MLLFDRYQGCSINSDDLPSEIDLGRYYISQTNEDITNRVINVGTDKIIRQGLLENENVGLQELFCQFYHLEKSATNDEFEVVPLAQCIKDKLFLNDFERTLEKELFHIEEIFRHPHYLLQRTIEKVNVSRAKRIPSKSYQNLASHTEDWLHKSIVDFKPRRILNEELDFLYDIYENQATVAFIERCLRYLGGRIKEIYDIKDFLVEYERILSDRDDEKGWFKKINRNLALIGEVYEDQYNHRKYNRNNDLAKTQERLSQVQKRLKALQRASLFDEVNKRHVQSLLTEKEIMPTNVMANHKHYRYVRELWRGLNNVSNERSDDELAKYEQEVIRGVRSYAKALITYTVRNTLEYNLTGNYSHWEARHDHYCKITMHEQDDSCIGLNVGGVDLRFVAIANDSSVDSDIIVNRNLFLLSLGNSKKHERIISVSPYDADSVERVGAIIKSYIIKNLVSRLREKYAYPHQLRDFVTCVNSEYVIFDNDFTYSFKGLAFTEISPKSAIEILSQNEEYKKRSRSDRDEIRNGIESLVNDINKQSIRLFSQIVCFNCMNTIPRRNLRQLSYIQCDCGFILDSTGSRIIYKNKDEKYAELSNTDWGMDYVEIRLS